jgi:predicted anti-sigma-YlaC factor YlaD
MNEHDRIRSLLPLAASGDISPEDLRRLGAHLADCEPCRRVSDDFASLCGALRAIPTPQPAPELLAQVRALADSRLGNQRWRSEARLIAPLVASSWMIAVLTWPLLRDASGWMLNWWRGPGDGFAAVLAVYSVAGLLLASVSALAVAQCARMNGRIR